MTREELLQEMERILETDGEKAAEAFVVQHFTDLPDDVKGTALLWFYTDAIGKRVADEDPVIAVQEEGMKALEELDALQKELSEATI